MPLCPCLQRCCDRARERAQWMPFSGGTRASAPRKGGSTMGIGSMAAVATVGMAALLAQAGSAKAAAIAIFATTSLRQALEKLGPQFERASGHKLTYKLGTSAPLKRQIDAGDPFDLAILVPASLDALINDGKVVAETRTDIARSAIGVAVRAGAPKPETGTAEIGRAHV